LGATGLLGLGLGTLLRRSGGGIATLSGGIFASLVVAGIFGPAGMAVSRYVPMIMLANSISGTHPVPGTLSAPVADAVMLLYAAIALAGGTAVLSRRDA